MLTQTLCNLIFSKTLDRTSLKPVFGGFYESVCEREIMDAVDDCLHEETRK
jgi:hypothetical protein